VVVGCVVIRVALRLYRVAFIGVVSAVLASSSMNPIHLPGCILEKMMERPVVLCTMMVCPVLARIIIPGHATSLVVLGFYEVDPIIEI
jgi:hypothetical protein